MNFFGYDFNRGFNANVSSLKREPKKRRFRKRPRYKKIDVAFRPFNFEIMSGLLPIIG